ncbi:hypothetical protein V5O48_011134 [Marasmius crinis-equi]|uniref:Methyltransferase n=1 Tax=Marasmius crinis-equi TaxID=585013 RepID=A0ABR3F6X0_9AGAR
MPALPRALPAYQLKALKVLDYPISNFSLHLRQSDDGQDNGSCLWIGSQVLSAYVSHCVKPATTAIELGSGIGLTSLVLSTLGWKRVIATDIAPIISSVLSHNIANNLVNLGTSSASNILVRELDWTIPPGHWTWNDGQAIASASRTSIVTDAAAHRLPYPFELIVTADTVYEPSLIEPLLRTMHALSTESLAISANGRVPLILVCLERRDPALMDSFLADARNRWNFRVDRISDRRVSKALEKSGLHWSRSDWEGVEIWKFVLDLKGSGPVAGTVTGGTGAQSE